MKFPVPFIRIFPFYTAALFYFSFYPLELSAQNITDKFDYKGDILVRGYFLRRDLPLTRQNNALCGTDEYLSYIFADKIKQYNNSVSSNNVNSPCREKEDFYTTRFRLDVSFRPNIFSDIVLGTEIGHLTFGRDNGGKGSAVNIETSKLYLDLHNKSKSLSLISGVFPVGTPAGIVIASSGAGLKSKLETQNNTCEFSYLRKEDNSNFDGDSNGFSDSNYRNIHLSIFSWKNSSLRWLRSELYFVHRNDSNPGTEDNDENETSSLLWSGLHLQFRMGRLNLLLHGIANTGNFKRPFEYYPGLEEKLKPYPEIKSIIDQTISAGYPLRSEFDVAAGAGQFEISYKIQNTLKMTALAAGGSGRLGIEPNGDPVDFRKDQFRTAGSAYQGSEITLDSSGGYSLIPLGKLTGIVQRGVRMDWDAFHAVSLQFSYHNFTLYRTPTIDQNKFFTLHFDTEHPNNHYGDEFNASLTWEILSDLKFTIKAARFDAGEAYKILNDVEYGDEIYETAFFLQQAF